MSNANTKHATNGFSKSSLNPPFLLAAISVMTCLPAYGSSDGIDNSANANQPENPVELQAWTIKTTPQLSYSAYKNSATRAQLSSVGVFTDFQYLERGGVTLGATRSNLKMKAGLETLQQNNIYVSGQMNFTPDLLPGNIKFRTDIHRANNNDVTNETNGVYAVAPQISFLNFARTYYLDLGYARSKYGDSYTGNGSLAVTQWTPTVGFGFNQGMDWLQLRAYEIHVSNALRGQNKSGSTALETKLTHYLAGGNGMPAQVQAAALLGQRSYAVDSDSGSIYNLADRQRGSASLGALWKLATHTQMLIQAGQEKYQNSAGTNYSATNVYLGLTRQW
jgi:hypothetical protein